MLVILFAAQSVQADTTAVTLFPDSAIIEEQADIPVTSVSDHRTGVIFLPGQADPSSLAFHPPEGVVLTDISPESVVSIDSEQIAALKTELDRLVAQKGRLEARKKGLDATITFWQSRHTTEQGSLEQFKELAAIMGKEIETAMIGMDTTSEELKILSQEIERITRQITAIQGKTTRNWKIILGFSPGKENTIPCTWSYAVKECGWKPIYRLEALSSEHTVRFTWQARVHQGTGLDWNNVRLSLATGKTHLQPNPPSIRPWILKPLEPVEIDSRSFMLEEAAAPRSVMQRAAMPAKNEAVEQRKGTFSTWELGLRTIVAGDDVMVRVKDAVWPAEFKYVLRPSVSGFGFLHTEVEMNSSLDLPRGEAMFLVDGAFLRKQDFSFSGNKLNLFFGPDPLVRAKTVLKNKKSGNSGMFSQKKTWTWAWDLIIANDTSLPIEAVIEEPRPLSRNKDITLSISGTPAPEDTLDQPEIMTWNLNLAPETKATISMHVEARAPEDMQVDPGWRW
jgi:uncharacterized protein (TIGR02231 family)